MAQSQHAGRRAASKLVTSAQTPSAHSAFLPRVTRRRNNRLATASTLAGAGFGALLEFTQSGPGAEMTFDANNVSTDSATFEVWIKTTVKTQQMLFQTGYIAPWIYIENDQIGVQWGDTNGVPIDTFLSADTAVISDGEWHHIAVTFANGNIRFFKDGIMTADVLTAPTFRAAYGSVMIGGQWSYPGFVGQMWNIKIWPEAGDAAAIQADMYRTPSDYTTPTDLVLLSSFNVANNTVTNLSNNTTGPTGSGLVTWDALPQPATYAFELTGNGSDYVEIGNLSAQVDTTAATFECWMQMSTAPGANTTAQAILLCRAPGDAAPIIAYNPTDRLGTYWNEGVGTSADTRPISDGAWHHIAVVFNNNQVTFYKDGIPTNETFTVPNTQISGGDLQVGAAIGSSQAFNGRITDVRVWRVARSLSDIQGNMYMTFAGTEPGLVGLNNLSTYSPSNTAITNMVNGYVGFLAGNVKVVPVVGPQAQQPVPQSVWTYPIPGIAPLGPQMSPQGLFYAENVTGSNNGTDGAYLRSLDLQDHTLNWSYKVSSASGMTTPVIPATVAVGTGAVYVGAQNSEYNFGTLIQLHSVNVITGQSIWTSPVPIGARSFACRPVVAGSRIVIGINAIETLNPPTVNTVLASVNVTTGAYQPGLVIQDSAVSYMTDPVVIPDSNNNTVAYFGFNSTASSPAIVQAVNMDTNQPYWGDDAELSAPLTAALAVTDQYIYAVCQNGDIFGLNLADGSIAWKQNKSSSQITSKPVVIGTAVYVGSTDGNLYALDGATGNELWRLNAGSQITTDLITEDGAIYFATQGNGAELPPTFFSVDAASQGNDTLIYPVPDADTILFDQGQSNGVVYFYSKQNVYAVNMDMILHEFNVDTKLTVEDYDTSSTTTTDDPTGNDTSYRITLALNDPLKAPRVNQAVKIWASATVYLTNWLDSNGNPIVIGPNAPFLVQSDGSGEVSLAVSAYDDGSHGGTGATASPLVNCPAIYAWANFMMPGEAIVIYPDHEHMGQLSNVQGSAPATAQATRSYAVTSTLYLNQATSYEIDPNNPPNRLPLMLSTYQDSQSLTDVASTVRNTIGTRNTASASVARVSAVGDPNSKYIAYPDSMPNVNYASDNTQPVTRPFVPGADSIFTMDLSGANGKPTNYLANQFDDARPANLSPVKAPMAASSTRRIHIAGIGEVEAIDSIGDFFKNVIKGAEKVAKMAWKWASNAVNTIIHTAENIYTLTITSLEDAVTAVVGFFKSVVADIKKAIEWLSALFNFKNILANHNFIKSYVTNTSQTGGLDQMQTWVTNQIAALNRKDGSSDIDGMFNTFNGKGQSNMQGTGQGIAGQTVQSQQGPNSNPNDAYNTGGNNNATQCKFMNHKMKENTGNNSEGNLTAPAPFRPKQPQQLYMPWIAQGSTAGSASAASPASAMRVAAEPDSDTIIGAWKTFVGNVLDALDQDFKNSFNGQIGLLKGKLSDPKAMLSNGWTDLLAILQVLADDMIKLGYDIALDFLQLMDTILAQIQLWLTQTLDVPFISRLYKLITGDDLTFLDVFALVVAVPTTILMEVIAGTPTPTALVAARLESSVIHPLDVAVDEVGKIFLGITNFIASIGGALIDSYVFLWSATATAGDAEVALFGRIDVAKDVINWAIGMATSLAWSSWTGKDWGFWAVQAVPMIYNFVFSFFKIPTGAQVAVDTAYGVIGIILSAVYAAEYPSSYKDAPHATGITLAANLFGNFSYPVELPALAGADGAVIAAIGKLIFDIVNAILALTGNVENAVHPPPSSATTQLAINLA